MTYLLDSDTLVLLRADRKKLPSAFVERIEEEDGPIFYSAVTPWVLAMKSAGGLLPLPDDFFTTLPNLGFTCLPVEEHHVASLRELPRLPHDPFDRMLVAQARAEGFILITRNRALADYPVRTLLV